MFFFFFSGELGGNFVNISHSTTLFGKVFFSVFVLSYIVHGEIQLLQIYISYIRVRKKTSFFFMTFEFLIQSCLNPLVNIVLVSKSQIISHLLEVVRKKDLFGKKQGPRFCLLSFSFQKRVQTLGSTAFFFWGGSAAYLV